MYFTAVTGAVTGRSLAVIGLCVAQPSAPAMSVAQPRRRLRAKRPPRKQRPAVAAALAAGAATAGVAASTVASAETLATLAIYSLTALPMDGCISELGMQISIRGTTHLHFDARLQVDRSEYLNLDAHVQ